MNAPAIARLRVALVGAGYVSRHHLAALKALDFVDVVGIADLDLAAAQALAAQSGVPHAARTLAELAVHRPNAVYVLTPPASHCALALEAMDLGCHVLVEKPMAETVAECDAMIAKAAERGLTLSVNHSDRLDPVVLRALELVRSGACGDVIAVDMLRSSDYPPYAGGPLPAMVRQGSYPFRDLGVHGMYLLEAFLGPVRDLAVEFRGTGANPNLRFDEWSASAFGEKGIGRLQISWNVRPMQSRLVIQGTKAVVEVDRFLQIVRVSRSLPGPKFVGMILTAFFNAVRDVFRVPFNVLRFATRSLKPSPGIRRGAELFARALHEGTEPPVSPAEGRRIIELIESHCRRADEARTQELEARFAPLEPADVLVTGAAGLLGRALVKRLAAEGRSVRVLVRRAPAWLRDMPGVGVVVGDLGEPRIVDHAVAGVKRVFHVGAAMKGGPGDFEAGTVWGTRNVVDSCLRHGIERLVYVSSMSVLDAAGRDPSRPVTEDSPLEPFPERRGAYTQTKLTAERHVLEAVRERGLKAVILRPGQIFGPGAERGTPNATVGIAGRWIAVGSPSQTLPLVYLDDVVDALVAADAKPGIEGRLFHVVDPEPVTHALYIEHCREYLGKDLKLVRVPKPVFLFLAWGVELLGKMLKRGVPLTRYRVHSLRPLANFDLTAATRDLGWKPAVGAREGLRRTFGPRGA